MRSIAGVMSTIIIVATTLLVSSLNAAKSENSGNYWMNVCRDGASGTQMVECYSYMRGLADGLNIWRLVQPNKPTACIPYEVTSSQLRAVALKFMRANPEHLHETGDQVLFVAFSNAWPCKK